MPLYPLILWIVQSAVAIGGFAIVEKLFDLLLEEVKQYYGLDDNDSRILVANTIFDVASFLGIGTFAIEKKIGINVAKKLGFTNKGYVKRALSTKGASSVAKIGNAINKKAALGFITKAFKSIASPTKLFWLYIGWTQAIEPGIYQPKQANDLYEKFLGFRPFPEKGLSLSPGNFSAERFNDLAKSLETAGVKGFEMGFPLGTFIYTRENLAAIIEHIYGQAILAGKTLNDYRDTIELLQPYLIGGTTTPRPAPTTANTSFAPSVAPQTKVFTGVLSQGVVGSGLSFTPRPDDLIESLEEMQQAINNNVAPYLASLLSKVAYEIKVVPSIIVNGVQQRGQAQQIVSGYYKDGRAKYKTVINKFAVANLYIATDRGTRSKLTTLNLGPVDAVKFQPSQTMLLDLSETVAKNVVTSNTDDINTVVSKTPTDSITPKTAEEIKQATGVDVDFAAGQPIPKSVKLPASSVTPELFTIRRAGRPSVTAPKSTVWSWLRNQQTLDEIVTMIQQGIKDNGGEFIHSETLKWYYNLTQEDFDLIFKSNLNTDSRKRVAELSTQDSAKKNSGSPTRENLPEAALLADTLAVFYSAQGLTLPSIGERAELYQSLGLGQSAFYTGTAEQNTKLLRALQGRPL